MTGIKLILTGAHVQAEVSGDLTSGMVGVPVTIEYDGAWEGLTKNLVCRCGRPYYPPDRDNTWIIPEIGTSATVAPEAMQADMHLYLGIEGCSSDGTLVMPTHWVDCGPILPGARTVSARSAEPTQPIWTRLKEDIARLQADALTEEYVEATIDERLRAGLADITQTLDSAVLCEPQTLKPTQKAQARTNIGAVEEIPAYVREEAERVAAAVHARQRADTISFIVCADLHYTDPANAAPNPYALHQQAAMTHMGQAMGLIREKVHIDFTAMLGDMFWDSGETAEEARTGIRFANSCLYAGSAGIPQFRTRGNHDNGPGIGANFSAAEIFANIGVFNSGAVYGDRTAGYCYRDFEAQKIRVICLNSSESGGCLFSADQVAWLANVLDLSEKGSDWHSILLSHHPLDWGLSGGVSPISTVGNAKGIICAIHGHIHNFKVDAVTGTSVTRIGVPNAGHGRENQYGETYGVNWGEDTTYSKWPGTAKDTAFCVFTIDPAEKMIYADHYGAGYSRAVPFSGPGYTNLVPTATAELNGTAIYNGIGYQDNAYVSTDGFGSADGYVAVGFLPLNKTDVIYVRGAEITQEDKVRLYVSTEGGPLKFACKAPSVSGGYFADTAGTQRFTFEQLGDLYYRLTPIQDQVDSFMYYRISLRGTGENLVITHNEPIG